MIYFTSDTHYNHKNIIKFCNRPFKDVDHMQEEMISRWNSIVMEADDVYLLGDFVFGGRKEIAAIVARLNGRIHVIRGNHDKGLKGEVLDLFQWVKDYYELKWEGNKIVLSHYPFEVWNKSHHGSWHLHGHNHGTLQFKDIKRIDVGVDNFDYYPVPITRIAEIMKTRGYDAPDGHGERR